MENWSPVQGYDSNMLAGMGVRVYHTRKILQVEGAAYPKINFAQIGVTGHYTYSISHKLGQC